MGTVRRGSLLVVVVVLGAAALSVRPAEAVQICPDGVCRPLACSGQFVGWARWEQNVSEQSDAEQDELMDRACREAYQGSRAATSEELVDHCIPGLPAENSSGDWLTGRCPGCEGRAGWSPPPVSGHCRTCVRPGDPMPRALPPEAGWHDYCCQSQRSVACVR